MRLPDDKAEKTKVLVLSAIGIVATIYVLVQYAFIPLHKSNKLNSQKITEIKAILVQSEKDVATLAKNSGENIKSLEKILKISDQNILHPSLGGNYSLNAGATLERITKESGMDLKTPGSAKITKIQGASIPASSDIKAYSMNLGFSCSLKELTETIDSIKRINPYLGIRNLKIIANNNSPEKHSISFTLSWLIWGNPEMRTLVKEKFEAEKQPNGDSK